MSWTAPVTEQGAESVTGYVLYRNDGSLDGVLDIELTSVPTQVDACASVLSTEEQESTESTTCTPVSGSPGICSLSSGSGSCTYGPASGGTIDVTGLVGGTMYKFSVAAKSEAGLGDRSVIMEVSTSSPIPDVPEATHQTASSISLEWSAPTVDTGVSETGYRVYEVSVDLSATKTYSLEYEGCLLYTSPSPRD